jgi:AGCS family alanine or glycine:cation symporter
MDFLIKFNELLTGYVVFPFLIVLGLYLTIRLRGVQITKFKLGFSQLMKRNAEGEGNISHFEAISAVLAGNFGTGNISGMAIALATGGPGALVWMWVMAVLGAAIQYVSSILGVRYRTINEKGEFVGGPMYYLSRGLGYRGIAAIFACLTLFASVTVGNFAQVNSMSLPLRQLGLDPFYFGLALAFLVAIVSIGGITRIAKFTSLLVPLKAALYLGVALTIILLNFEKVLPALYVMFHTAFNPQALLGGFLGIGILKVITTGFDRGIFATDAGTGIVPILQASARTTHPMVDGAVTLVAPFLVMVVCTMTGLILLITGAWQMPGLESTNMVTYAFKVGIGHEIGAHIVTVALVFFGYTTILAWACCAEKAAGYLFGIKWTPWVKYGYIALVPFGAILEVETVWVLADICISLMLLTNLIGIARLSNEVIALSKESPA